MRQLVFACSTPAHEAAALAEAQRGRAAARSPESTRRKWATAAAAASLEPGPAGEGDGEEGESAPGGPRCPVQLFRGLHAMGAGWSGDLLVLLKRGAVVDPQRPDAGISVSKTCGVPSLAAFRSLLSDVVLPLSSAAAGDCWGHCPHREQRQIKRSLSQFCALLDDRIAAYSDGQRGLSLPTGMVHLGLTGGGAAASEGIAAAVNSADRALKVLLQFDALASTWVCAPHPSSPSPSFPRAPPACPRAALAGGPHREAPCCWPSLCPTRC